MPRLRNQFGRAKLVLAAGLVLLPLSAAMTSTAFAQSAAAPSLAERFKHDFLIGTAFDFVQSNPITEQEQALIKHQFNVITPENSMKPDSVHPAEDRWTWGTADKLVDFCQKNDIKLYGHTLAWHAQTGRWFFEGENGQPVTREKAIERLRTHIHTVVGRYKGKVIGWDVVNEAISDGGDGSTENLRQSQWVKAIGPDYLTMAFKFAREADPDCQLYYNDYNIEKGGKFKSSLLLLKRLIKEGAPITGVGIQGHWGLNHLPYEELDNAITEYKKLGLRVSISELDVVITGQGGGQLDPGPGPEGAPRPATRPAGPGIGQTTRRARVRAPLLPPTPEQIRQQADAYAKFFQIFLKHRDVIDRVTFWGINDPRSWRQGQAPLLFDAQNNPKPAFDAVMNTKPH